MKKISILLFTLVITGVASLQVASAQFLTNTAGLSGATDLVAKTANYSDIRIEDVIARVIQLVLGFLAITFIIIMIVAGFRWMTAQGNEEQVTEAQHMIRAAIIGLIVVMLTYSVTYFVFKYVPFSGGGGMPNPI